MRSVTLLFPLLAAAALCGRVTHVHVPQPMTWTDAQSYCRANYTDLSSVLSETENLTFPQDHHAQAEMWIGLYKNAAAPHGWSWSEGGRPLREFWETGHGNKPGLECATVKRAGRKWSQSACEPVRREFFCFSGRRLVLVRENRTWEKALEHCREKYRSLASLASPHEFYRAQEGVAAAGTGRVWAGLRYLGDRWLWVNGDAAGTHRGWEGGSEPYCPAVPRHCGALPKQGAFWESWNCAERMNFLCYV